MPQFPGLPFEALQVSSAPLRVVMNTVVKTAETFGFWRQPRKGAASDAPEMGLLDNLNWVYKSKNPVRLPDPDLDQSGFMKTDTVALTPKRSDGTFAELSLSFAGDILRTHRATPAKDQVYAEVADLLFDTDVAIANYESPVTTQPLVDEVIGDAGPPTECANTAHFDALTGHQGRHFDVVNLANNHVFDMGVEGVETTLSALSKHGMLPLGVTQDPAQLRLSQSFEKHGIKLGFATCTFGTNGQKLPDGSGYNVAEARLTSKHQAPDLDLLKAQVTHAKEMENDLVIAIVHWGFEFEHFPRRSQQLAAEELAEFGADLIICHHPHVVQPVQLYRTKSGARTVPIAYSLGSLLWGFAHDDIATSLVLQVGVQKTEAGTVLTGLQKTAVRWRADTLDGQTIQRVGRVNA